MRTNAKILSRNFNVLGYVYNPLKKLFLANKPEKVIFESVKHIGFHSNILVVGGGADSTLNELFKSKKCDSVTHVDISSVLSKKGQRILLQENPKRIKDVKFVVSPFLSFDDDDFDAVILPFYLDLFLDDEVRENIQHLKSKLKKNAKVYVIDFSSAESQKWWVSFKIRMLYILFRPISKVIRKRVPNYNVLFSENGLKLEFETSFYNQEYEMKVFTTQ